jgi:hypothetical protein
MSQHDLVLILQEGNMLIIMTDEKLVRVFGLFAMSSLLVLRTIR